MPRYPHWTEAEFPAAKTFWASIAKIDEKMREDPYRWTLSKEARLGQYADFKPGKLSHWKNIIRTSGQVTPTELSLRGGDDFDVMDGRHRIYALHEEGFTDVLIQVLPMEPGDEGKIDRLAERLAP
ncbi:MULTISPECIES: hypothetical protein [Paracoccus]|uniref:Uncharacterized protein n=1 Tax=Paracoccus versutus TaxID=34007 RepID=A0A369U0W5_PARVE|nr:MULTISPECIES: hypothetical protein [Paracoccus]MBT0779327.1 hypothetical protein [Paracoccus sp. pheM1]MDF3856159.1 hypothetical protein [Paracoccus pantotrophus]MDK8873379.1 hypothetical protein [Paracoccus sp. SSJ]RDD70087.1 hypothetical protein DVR11_18025 [Paracoccus versutus]REF68314.1 hypothetical protein BDD41_3353 [Paracoccus versutus]